MPVHLLQHCWHMNDAKNAHPTHRLRLISGNSHPKRVILSPGGQRTFTFNSQWHSLGQQQQAIDQQPDAHWVVFRQWHSLNVFPLHFWGRHRKSLTVMGTAPHLSCNRSLTESLVVDLVKTSFDSSLRSSSWFVQLHLGLISVRAPVAKNYTKYITHTPPMPVADAVARIPIYSIAVCHISTLSLLWKIARACKNVE